jgi:hypothetical protein
MPQDVHLRPPRLFLEDRDVQVESRVYLLPGFGPEGRVVLEDRNVLAGIAVAHEAHLL